MSVEVEVLEMPPEMAKVALYYPITSPIAAANDQSRVAAGIRLSALELQALKDGILFELVISVSTNRLSKEETERYIESLWVLHQKQALADYNALYRDAELVGKSFDGTTWS